MRATLEVLMSSGNLRIGTLSLELTIRLTLSILLMNLPE